MRKQAVRSCKLAALALVLLSLAPACGRTPEKGSPVSSQQPSPTAKTVEQALPRLKAMVDATAAVVAAGFQLEPDSSEAVGCEDAENDDGTITADYGVKFALPEGTDIAALFEKGRSYWQQHGYGVGDDKLTTSDPRLHAWQGDYGLVLHIVPDGHMAYLGGSTPCLPETGKDE